MIAKNDDQKGEGGGDGPARRCPICGKPADRKASPFCSSRCADVDLSRWLSGVYAIPVTGADDDEDGDAAAETDGEGR